MINKLKEYRQAHGLTQSQLAERAHVSPRTIISLEKGQYKPSILLAYRLSVLLQTSMEELFCLRENKQREDDERETI